jgi:acetyl/propionyl-CoA carboxylase alpha subunit
VVGTDFDSLLAKIIVRAGSFKEATSKTQRVLRELSLSTNTEIKTNINVLAGILEHQDWMDGTIDTLWLERNLDSILRLGKSAVGVRTTGVIGLEETLEQHQRENETANTSGSMSAAGASALLQPGTHFHLTLSPSSTSSSVSASQEREKHIVTLTSIAHNAFPENLSGVIQTTLTPLPMAFSLSQSTSVAVGGGEGFDFADPNNPQHVPAPLTGKLVEVHPALEISGSLEKRVKKGEALAVMSVMKMENTVVAPYDGIVEKVGSGVKAGIILGEGMLVCVLRPIETSRL